MTHNLAHGAQVVLGWLSSSLDRGVRWLGYVAMLLVGALSVIVAYEVILRYFLHRPTVWVTDFSAYMILYICLLAAASVQMQRRHVAIDVIIGILGRRARATMELITTVLATLACSFLVWQSALFTWHSFRRGVLIRHTVVIPEYVIMAIIPIGSFFLAAVFLKQVCQLAVGTGRSPNQQE